jgi:hypothetical protein
MPVGNLNRFRARRNGREMVLALPHTADDLPFGLDGPGRCELAARCVLPLDGLELACGKPRAEVAAHLGKRDLSHATAKRIADNCSLVYDGFALEVLVAGKCHSLADTLLRVHFL